MRRLAVLNPVRNTCFVAGCKMRVMSGRAGAVVLVWLLCKVAGGPSRTPATCQGRSPKPTTTRPPGGRR
eukprot:1596295-Prymnesium_polylepis.1